MIVHILDHNCKSINQFILLNQHEYYMLIKNKLTLLYNRKTLLTVNYLMFEEMRKVAFIFMINLILVVLNHFLSIL